MDKKSIFLGIIFLVGGFALMSWNNSQQTKARQERLLEQARENERALEESGWTEENSSSSTPEIVANAPADKPAATPEEVAPEEPVDELEKPEELLVTIENKELSITLSSYGAAIEQLILKQYPTENPHVNETTTPVSLNRFSESSALSLNKPAGSNLMPIARFYELVNQTAHEATFQSTLANGLIIERTFTLTNGEDAAGPKPFTIHHETVVKNNGTDPLILDRLFLDLGTAAPTLADYRGFNLNASYFSDGDYETIPITKFRKGGLIFKRPARESITEDGIIEWGAVKNQFFVTIFTPDIPGESITARPVRFPQDPSTGKVPVGVNAAMEFGVPVLQPGEEFIISGGYYAGPKSFDRLSKMDKKQEDVMQLGWFLGFFVSLVGFVAKMLLTLMSSLHGILGNWGIAIILTTFVIRLCLWPLTAKAARASKRMQKLQKPIQELREKYQDNPQRMNQEMMELWKKHKINPLSGCWPVLLQFPIFIAFFNLLRNSSDLRFAEFLWIHDLSMPDATIPLPGDAAIPFLGSAINILPFIWVVSMFFQMKMMPQPSIDNAQTKMIKWMPFIFFPFTYYFSSGLVLYWTTTNCFSIFQQWMTNRKRDQEDIAIEEEIAEMDDHSKAKLPSGPLISKRKKSRKKGGNNRGR